MEGKRTRLISENAGEREQMDVEIREVDPFNLWVRASTSGLHIKAAVTKLASKLFTGQLSQEEAVH